MANWIDRGYLPAFRTPGGHRRVDPKVLTGFLVERGIPVPESLDTRPLVLIVEDDVQVAETLRSYLEQPEGRFNVHVIHDGVSIDMEGYAGRISDTDIWNVVNFLRSLTPLNTPK